MLHVAVFALVAVSALAASAQPQYYSFSQPVGSGSGRPYAITGKGRITVVRVWEVSSTIRGFQFRYGSVWSPVAGYKYGEPREIELFEGEAIIQISGKYAHYLHSVAFTTNRGRTLIAGLPTGHSFNMYPGHQEAELRFISGRVHGAITSIGAHWVVDDSSANNSTEH